jgi:hypothetical protein
MVSRLGKPQKPVMLLGKSRNGKTGKTASSAAVSKLAASALSRQPDRKQDTAPRSILELTTAEREEAFRDAAAAARDSAFEQGRPIIEFRDGRIVRVWSDGRIEAVDPLGHGD